MVVPACRLLVACLVGSKGTTLHFLDQSDMMDDAIPRVACGEEMEVIG